jgi:hypothetical protein
MREDRIIWLATGLFEQCATDADRFYDRETGGTLMGYWHSSGPDERGQVYGEKTRATVARLEDVSS